MDHDRWPDPLEQFARGLGVEEVEGSQPVANPALGQGPGLTIWQRSPRLGESDQSGANLAGPMATFPFQ